MKNPAISQEKGDKAMYPFFSDHPNAYWKPWETQPSIPHRPTQKARQKLQIPEKELMQNH